MKRVWLLKKILVDIALKLPQKILCAFNHTLIKMFFCFCGWVVGAGGGGESRCRLNISMDDDIVYRPSPSVCVCGGLCLSTMTEGHL